jgi:hypothetical protein
MTPAIRSVLPAIRRRNIVWGDWLAPALILVTPFVNFLNFHNYGLFRLDSLSGVTILACLGLAASLSMTLWPQVRLPFLPWPVLPRPLVIALGIVFLVDFQAGIKKLFIGWLSHVFSDGDQCELCTLLMFGIVFLLFFAIAYALKRNAGIVFGTIFAVILAAIIALPPTSGARRTIQESDIALPAVKTNRPDLPPIVHIVLDEQIGIEGIPKDLPGGVALRAELLDYYVGNGFRVYGGAFSQYHNTADSIANLVNATVRHRRLQYVTPSGFGYSVTENAWFDRLGAQGYRIHVYQTDYLDFCGGKGHRIAKCTTVPASGIAVLEDLEIATSEKVALLFNKFSKHSSLRGFAMRLPSYLRSIRPNTEAPSAVVPDREQQVSLGAPWAKIGAERLIDELGKVESGTAYFAHLLLPHRGFVLDENCRMKPDLGKWYDRPSLGLKSGRRLTGSSRHARYIEYFKQVRCAHRTIDEVVEALSRSGVLDKAIIIVHGDHGSRIAGLLPLQSHASSLTRSDLTDSFSTLFAIRSPDLPAGYNSSARSVQALFAELVYGRPIDDERAVVFLTPRVDGPDAPFGEYPFPGFE